MTLEEQQAEFLKNTYDYTLVDGDQWVTFGDRLIVANPAREPFMVEIGGEIVKIVPHKDSKITEQV